MGQENDNYYDENEQPPDLEPVPAENSEATDLTEEKGLLTLTEQKEEDRSTFVKHVSPMESYQGNVIDK